MKTFLIALLLIFLIQISGFSQVETNRDSGYSTLKGPYLGQKPPSETASTKPPKVGRTIEGEYKRED